MSSGQETAERVARPVVAAFAAAAASLGLGHDEEVLALELERLLAAPLAAFALHPNWPTGLTGFRVPLELSVAIAPDSEASLRYAVDVTDHRLGLAGNWATYVDAATTVTRTAPAGRERLWSLLVRHLDGIAPLYRSRMVPGRAYLEGGEMRGAVYFHTRGYTEDDLRARFRSEYDLALPTYVRHGGLQPTCIEWMAYDFRGTDGEPSPVSLYWWIDLDDGRQAFGDVTDGNPDFDAARELALELRPQGPAQPFRSVGVQFGPDGNSGYVAKTMFRCDAWGWSRPAGLDRLAGYLESRHGLDLAPLGALLSSFVEHSLPLRPTLFSIGAGAGGRPSVAFYFSPEIESTRDSALQRRGAAGSTGTRSTSAAVRDMIERGIRYLVDARRDDGHWSDFALDAPDGVWLHYPLQGESDEWVTAYVLAVLARHESVTSLVRPSVDWLLSRYRDGAGWGWNADVAPDADATATGIVALHLLDTPLPDSAAQALRRYRLSSGGYRAYVDWDVDDEHGIGALEIAGAALRALVLADLAPSGEVVETVRTITSMQRDDGGWNAFWWQDDLFATARVVEAFRALRDRAGGPGDPRLAGALATSIARAQPSIQARPVSRAPLSLGLWLTSWFLADGPLDHPTVGRVVAALESQQAGDGRWLATPAKRIARSAAIRPWGRADTGKLYVDRQCIVTTATAIDGLRRLEEALGAAGDSLRSPP